MTLDGSALVAIVRKEPGFERIVEALLTVAPFTKEHWRGAVREYEKRLKSGGVARPAFGQCLSAAVAAKLGAPLVEQPRVNYGASEEPS